MTTTTPTLTDEQIEASAASSTRCALESSPTSASATPTTSAT